MRNYLINRELPKDLIDIYFPQKEHDIRASAFEYDSISQKTLKQIEEIYKEDFELFEKAKKYIEWRKLCKSEKKIL